MMVSQAQVYPWAKILKECSFWIKQNGLTLSTPECIPKMLVKNHDFIHAYFKKYYACWLYKINHVCLNSLISNSFVLQFMWCPKMKHPKHIFFSVKSFRFSYYIFKSYVMNIEKPLQIISKSMKRFQLGL